MYAQIFRNARKNFKKSDAASAQLEKML